MEISSQPQAHFQSHMAGLISSRGYRLYSIRRINGDPNDLNGINNLNEINDELHLN